ncbi:MAG TPA: DUF2793 domain-containing protein [Sphingomicrobium sp.]
MDVTERLGLPLIASGQAQKEITHNEALLLVDVLVGGAVEEPPRNAPPSSPMPGQAWITGASPSGAWASKAYHVAGYSSGGWRLIPPTDGMVLLVKSTGSFATYRGGAWDVGEIRAAAVKVGGQQVVGSQSAAIASPTGGGIVDAEARTALGSILGALRAHGLIAT